MATKQPKQTSSKNRSPMGQEQQQRSEKLSGFSSLSQQWDRSRS